MQPLQLCNTAHEQAEDSHEVGHLLIPYGTAVQCKITSNDLNRLIELELELAKCKHCNQIYKTSLGQTKKSLVCTEVVVAEVEVVEVVEVVSTQCTVINCCSVQCP